MEVQRIAKEVASETGLSASQVFELWTSSNQRTHIKSNVWNMYGAYFKDHQEQELARLEKGERSCLAEIDESPHAVLPS